MDRSELINQFKEQLAEFRLLQSMCHECKELAQDFDNSPHGEDKICAWHRSWADKLAFE